MISKYCLTWGLTAILFAGLAPGVRAELTNQSNSLSNRVDSHQQVQPLTPEQRTAMIQELQRTHGFTNAPVRMTVEERRARMQKRIAELDRKRAEGTLTPVERRQLELLERSTNHPLASVKRPLPKLATPPGTTNFNLLSK